MMRQVLGATAAAAVITALMSACQPGPSNPGGPSGPSFVAVSGTPPGVGASSQFTATAHFADSTSRDVTSTATWVTSAGTIASVSPSGVVTAVDAGEADIRATYQGMTGTLHIAVAAGGTLTLLGVVTQTGSSTPVQNALVGVRDGVNAGRATSTDGNGFYHFGGLRTGSFILEATRSGYATADQAITLEGDLRFDFTMTATTPPVPPAPASPPCGGGLWSRVYTPSRLRVIDACRTVTGTITDQHTNDDGDIDVRLALDPPYRDLLNAGNMASLSGHLQTEAICQTAIRDAAAAAACRGFNGSIGIPPNGTHVQVTGTYVLDTNHGWMEIHPISVLTVIP